MDFAGKLADLQQSASGTADYAARRAATLRALALQGGEAVLDVGCGSGLFARDVAAAVGSSGKVCGIDLSDDQLVTARANCKGLANVELRLGNVLALPYPATSFDAVVSIQVLEYVDDVPAAVAEMNRVLKPGGLVVIFATMWATLHWNSRQPDLTKRMLDVWDTHAPHSNLPAALRALLSDAGFCSVEQTPVSILNCNYRTAEFSYWLAQIVAAIAAQREAVTPADTERWLHDFAEIAESNEYLFCLLAIVTSATKTA